MFKESKKLTEIATQLVLRFDTVGHIEINQCLFLVSYGLPPKASAKCYSLISHPVMFFTDKRFCIVVYDSNTDWMTDQQMAILILHELMHIPLSGNKLIDHDVKDFQSILDLHVNWHKPGQKVPDLLA